MRKRLLDSEWTILKALWNKEPQTLKSIVECIRRDQPDVDWNYKTYHSYLRIMQEKELIGAENINGKDKVYYPLISREDALKCESESLLGRISAASVGKLVALLADSDGLSQDDQLQLLEFSARLEKRSGGEGSGNADRS
jgi:predicted transcriptional regulator